MVTPFHIPSLELVSLVFCSTTWGLKFKIYLLMIMYPHSLLPIEFRSPFQSSMRPSQIPKCWNDSWNLLQTFIIVSQFSQVMQSGIEKCIQVQSMFNDAIHRTCFDKGF
jgi:hypothetical protein